MKIAQIAAASFFCAATAATSGTLDGTIFEQVGEEFQIDPLLLYSISLTESGYAPTKKQDARQPWPWAVGMASGAKFPASKEDAEKTLSNLKKRGYKNIDVGLMQVNIFWHKDKLNQEDLFNPLENLRVGAQILKKALDSANGDLVTGIGRYHNWTDSHRQARYALTVLSTYKKLSQSEETVLAENKGKKSVIASKDSVGNKAEDTAKPTERTIEPESESTGITITRENSKIVAAKN